jgi:hypothetical protein
MGRRWLEAGRGRLRRYCSGSANQPRFLRRQKKTAGVLRLRQFEMFAESIYQPNTCAKINGATMVASDSMTYLGVFTPSLPHVIFSLGTAPE